MRHVWCVLVYSDGESRLVLFKKCLDNIFVLILTSFNNRARNESSFDKETVQITETKLLKCKSEILRTSLSRASDERAHTNVASFSRKMRIISIEKTSRVAFPKKKKYSTRAFQYRWFRRAKKKPSVEREKRQAHTTVGDFYILWAEIFSALNNCAIVFSSVESFSSRIISR